MEIKMLFGVGLVFDTPEFGTIVMGANEELDELFPSTIQKMIGEEQVFEVMSSQINHSIAGKKNIGICLGKRSPQMKYQPVQSSTVTHPDKWISSVCVGEATWSGCIFLNLLCLSLLLKIIHVSKALEGRLIPYEVKKDLPFFRDQGET